MISIDEGKKLARLAKLNFSAEEMDSFLVKLNYVSDMIDSLKEIDCSDVEPLRSVCEMTQRTREDIVTVQDISSDLFANAPGSKGNFARDIKCFIVPKVVE